MTGSLARRFAPLALLGALPACLQPTVVRMFEGREVAGRYISPRAYTYYAFGADAEARGELGAALEAYEEAASADGESVEIWTRIGLVRCSLDRGDADEAFDEAEEQDSTFAPLWVSKARCADRRGDDEGALVAIDRAVAFDPGDVDARTFRANLLRDLGRPDEAARELHALTLEEPQSSNAWRARHLLAVEQGDAAVALATSARLRALEARGAPARGAALPAAEALERVDEALRDGDVHAAHHLGRRAGLVLADVAARAAALGRNDLAATQAETILRAEPTNGTARMVLASAADLLGDEARLTLALVDVPPSGSLTRASPLASALFAGLLFRRVDRSAARAFWEQATWPDAPGEDALTRETVARLEAVLAGDGGPPGGDGPGGGG